VSVGTQIGTGLPARGPDKFRDAARRSAAQAQNADRQCEQILDAMVHLQKQKLWAHKRLFAVTLRPPVAGRARAEREEKSYLSDYELLEQDYPKARLFAVNPLKSGADRRTGRESRRRVRPQFAEPAVGRSVPHRRRPPRP
jgi:hypothetical protein